MEDKKIETDRLESLVIEMSKKMDETNAKTMKITIEKCKKFNGRDLVVSLKDQK